MARLTIMRCIVAKSGAELDAREFLRRLDLADDRVVGAVTKQMRDNALHLEGEAKKLVPVDKGPLLRSGRAGKPKWSGHEVSAEVGFNMSYAAEVHETMSPAIDAKKRPGLTTQKKPPTKWGEAGGLYLLRPLRGMMDEYTKRIAKAVRKVLR
jgi:hypothetical protein